MAPELGATFVPGGFDDYYMPEVVAPSPQRYAFDDELLPKPTGCTGSRISRRRL